MHGMFPNFHFPFSLWGALLACMRKACNVLVRSQTCVPLPLTSSRGIRNIYVDYRCWSFQMLFKFGSRCPVRVGINSLPWGLVISYSFSRGAFLCGCVHAELQAWHASVAGLCRWAAWHRDWCWTAIRPQALGAIWASGLVALHSTLLEFLSVMSLWSGDARQKGVYSHIFHERGLTWLQLQFRRRTHTCTHRRQRDTQTEDKGTQHRHVQTDHICHIKNRDDLMTICIHIDAIWWQVGTRKFHLPDYLKAFLSRLGHEVETYVPQLGTEKTKIEKTKEYTYRMHILQM